MDSMKCIVTVGLAAMFLAGCAYYDEHHKPDGSIDTDGDVIPPVDVGEPPVDAPVSQPDAEVPPDACEPDYECVENHDCGPNAACRDHKCRDFCWCDANCENGMSCRSGLCRPE